MFKYILIIAVLAMTGTCQDTPWQVVPPEQYDTSPDLISSRNSGLNTILAQLFAEQKVSNTSGWHIIANNSISTYNTTTDIFYMFNLTLDDPAGDLLYTNFTIDVNRTNPNITVITSNSTNVVLNGTAPATTTPAASTTTPTSITIAPAASTTAPADTTTAPADNTTTPVDNTTTPADNTTAPADNTTTPADNTTAPAANTTNTTNTTTPAVSYYCNITLYGKNFTNVNGRSVPTPIARNYQLRNDATQLWFPVAKSVMQELDYFTFAGTNCSFKALLWHTLNFSGGFQSNIIKPPVQSPYYISSDYMDTTLSFKFHYPIPGDPHFATP